MACFKVFTSQPQKTLSSKKPAELLSPQPLPQDPSPSSTESNPVGRVQEYAQKHFWPLPVYSFECTGADSPATRLFTCTVCLRDQSYRGVGTSKRLAKRQAASELLHQLVTSPTAAVSTTPQLPPIPLLKKAVAPLDEDEFLRLRASKRLQSAARAGAEVGGMFRGVRSRKAGPPLPPVNLDRMGAAASASEQLLELGKTHRFRIHFLPLDSTDTKPAVHRSVVKLSTMPTIVVVGCGAGAEDSQEQACRAALEYLSVLTKDNLADKK